MNTEDQYSADDSKKFKSNLSIAIDGQENSSYKKSRTICNIRKDRFGSPIKKGGKHKICFRDKLHGDKNKLCDVVNITIVNCNESSLSNNDLLLKNNLSMNSNNSVSKPNQSKDNDINKLNEIIKKASRNVTPKVDENCSCACSIF